MGAFTADSFYEISFRSSWDPGAEAVGHLIIRRLDDHEIIAEIPAHTEDRARDLLQAAQSQLRGPAADFESAWGISAAEAAERGPDHLPRATVSPEVREPEPGERVLRADARVRVLPDPAEIFDTGQLWLGSLLHPLLSVELAAVNPECSGWLPLLNPVEPESGLLGEDTGEHWNDFACMNWISFRWTENGRLQFLGRRHFFQRESLREQGEDRLEAHYARAGAEFRETGRRWAENGLLTHRGSRNHAHSPSADGTAEPTAPLIDQLGGEPGYGNWPSYPPPAAFHLDESDPASPTLRLRDGRACTFIAGTAGYPWRADGPDSILMFFEPETRTVVYTFDWG